MVRARAQGARGQQARQNPPAHRSDLLKDAVAPRPSHASRTESIRWSEAGPSPSKLERHSDDAAVPSRASDSAQCALRTRIRSFVDGGYAGPPDVGVVRGP